MSPVYLPHSLVVHRVKKSHVDIYKGVPQMSILGPVLFNIFLNDIFHFTTSSTIYNYADDNTLAHADDNIECIG
jgi:hypothetical protein